ncbi:MAG: Gfo/Idh/MocA family oxidoreductase [Planctomycetota bacterium]|nr:Gfo/Idh/MocA family oxidoreductase [Planctomycetota bacterium]
MSSDPLPVVVIGIGGFGGFTLQAIRRSRIVKLVGLSDKNAELAQAAGRDAGVPAYTDNRSLLAETRPQAAYLAVPPKAAADLLAACAERGIHVWKELPLGRNLAEGVAMARRMDSAGLKFAIGTQRRFAVGYRRAYELRQRLGQVFLGQAHYLFNWGPNLGWRGDKAAGGGGALLELGYQPIDLLVWLLGLPEEVYGISAGGNRPDVQGQADQPLPVYDTDDTAAAILRYTSGAMATVVTTRCSGPVSEELSLHGRGGSLTACGETCTFRDPDGNVLDRAAGEADPIAVFQRQAEDFATAVANDDRIYQCTARENLLNLAVIEAIYLSDQTGQPENPNRLLKTHGLTAEDCLTPPQPAEAEKQ